MPAMRSSLKVASWNINSVRARIAIIEQFLVAEQPDILCLQETKVIDQDFPKEMFHRLGYTHIVLCGQRMHHGVAIISRVPLQEEGASRLAGQWRGAPSGRAAAQRHSAGECLCAGRR
jgi:exonuclease III